jgi:hypothetical protein
LARACAIQRAQPTNSLRSVALAAFGASATFSRRQSRRRATFPGPLAAMPLPQHLIAIEAGRRNFQPVSALLSRVFGASYAADDFGTPYAFRWIPDRWRRRPPTLPQVKPDARCIHGSFPAQRYLRTHPDAHLAFWLRHPVEFVAASYAQTKLRPVPATPLGRATLRGKLDLAGYAELSAMRNNQSRLLNGLPLERANFIGLAERCEESFHLFRRMHEVADWPRLSMELGPARAEFSPELGWHPVPEPLSADLRSHIEALNARDMDLYRRAEARFDDLCRSHGVAGPMPSAFAAPEDSSPLVFVHIQKTAGRTFIAYLRRIYGDGLHVTTAGDPWGDVPAGMACIAGHFFANRFRRRFPKARLVAWFRDPVERAISGYEYWMREPDMDNTLSRYMVESKISLEKWMDLGNAQNWQQHMMQDVPVENLAFVGITEEYERGLRLFERIFDLPAQPNLAGTNVNPRKPLGAKYDVEPRLRRKLEGVNFRDRELYERAKQRFHALCAQYGV